MVENRDFPFNKGLCDDGVIGLASPKDRLAAYIVDALLLLPLVQLLQAPFKRWILESFVFGESETVVWFRIINLIIFVFVFSLYYALMTYWGGQTLGKKFFSIKVISYQGKISFLNSCLRSVFILFEMICVGFPFLAIFSHALRRPIHDRVADTLVISLKSPVGFPTNKEKWKANVAGVAVAVVFFVTIAVYAILAVTMKDQPSVLSQYKKSCKDQISNSDESLNSGIELFIAQKISNECLFKHARDFLWDDKEVDLAHLAIALAFVEDEERSDKYLDEICKLNNEGTPCLFSQWVRKGLPLDDSEAFISQIQEGKQINDFYKAYAAALYLEQGQHDAVLSLLKKMKPKSHLQAYVSLLSFKSLLSESKWNQAFWVYQTSEHINHKHIVQFLKSVREKKNLSAQNQVKLLESFFPGLSDNSSKGRGLASKDDIEDEILAIYALIKEEL